MSEARAAAATVEAAAAAATATVEAAAAVVWKLLQEQQQQLFKLLQQQQHLRGKHDSKETRAAAFQIKAAFSHQLR